MGKVNSSEIVPIEIVHSIDSSLTYKKKFGISTTTVYQVEKDDSDYVLKFLKLSEGVWHHKNSHVINHLRQELRNLRLADGVEGITHLIRAYGEKYAVLKEFFDGKEPDWLHGIQSTETQIKLEHAVRNLHSLGIAGLDIRSDNIMVSHDEKDARIVDLGSGTMYNKSFGSLPFTVFRKLKSTDLRKLESISLGYKGRNPDTIL